MKLYEMNMTGYCRKTIQVAAKTEEEAYAKLLDLHNKQQREHGLRQFPEYCYEWEDTTLIDVKYVKKVGLGRK